MNSLVESDVKLYLQTWLRCDPFDCGTIVECMRNQARIAGHELDHRFAGAGLAAGPEARVAACIVERALGGNGCETSDYTVRKQIDDWIRLNPRKGL
jgi:hypothetical protein